MTLAIALLALLGVQMGACMGEPEDVSGLCDGAAESTDGANGDELESLAGDENVGEAQEALSSYKCGESKADGYRNGNKFAITVVHVDGKPVELNTANAYLKMAAAAQKDGVQLRVSSGFRTMKEQQYLYNCYKSCSCNNCNLAAVPGTSNHQSGHALDLNTSSGGVYSWLAKHAGQFGFKRTVPSEDWHWEYWGKKVDGPCGGPPAVTAKLVKATSSAKKIKGKKPKAQYEVCAGDKFKFWFQFENTGDENLIDLAKSGKDFGERVRLETPGKTPGTHADKLTGKKIVSLDLASNPNLKPSGKKCTAKGCKRSILPKKGFEATAPKAPGLYTTKWKLVDHAPSWKKGLHGVSKVATLTFQVKACAPKPPPSGSTTSSTGSGSSTSSTSATSGGYADDPTGGYADDPTGGVGGADPGIDPGGAGAGDESGVGGGATTDDTTADTDSADVEEEGDWSDEQAVDGADLEEDDLSYDDADAAADGSEGCSMSAAPAKTSLGAWTIGALTAAAFVARSRRRSKGARR